MKSARLMLLCVAMVASVSALEAQSIYERRDPYSSNLFADNRARAVGDVLMIVVNEATAIDGSDKTKLKSDTAAGATADVAGKYGVGKLTTREFSGTFSGQGTSNRSFDGESGNTIDRRFVDRLTVFVVGVMPNGNLVIEGRRTLTVTRETRVLCVSGIVRPLDISNLNTVASQSIGDLRVSYEGRGPESSFAHQGWLGRVVNKVWPF